MKDEGYCSIEDIEELFSEADSQQNYEE